MNGLPFVPCAEINIHLDPLADFDVNTLVDFDVNAVIDELDSMNNVQAGQPLALNEAALPLVEAAPVQEAAPAQYLAAQGVNPATRNDQFLSDLGTAWVDGPAVTRDLKDANVFAYDFEVDMEMDFPTNPAEQVLNEAGPSDPQAFQSSGGFEVPALPPLNNLPHPIKFSSGFWHIFPDNLDGLSDLQQLSFGNAEAGFYAVFDAWETRYIKGLPAFDGAPLLWSELSRSPGANLALLAARFQTEFKLSNEFMNTANAQVNGGRFRSLSKFSAELNKLPKFEGIGHFWRSKGTLLVNTISEMRSTGGQTWFDKRRTCSSLKHLVLL
jgi:hypothetical protein